MLIMNTFFFLIFTISKFSMTESKEFLSMTCIIIYENKILAVISIGVIIIVIIMYTSLVLYGY